MSENRKTNKLTAAIAALIAFMCILCLPGAVPDAAKAAQAEGPFVVMLDPGHGGNDPGATRKVNGTEYNERYFNDRLTEACYNRLVQYDNVIVYRTRVANNHISTYARAEYAKRVGAKLFLSFHINSSSAASVRGACTIIPSGNYRKALLTETADLTDRLLKKLESVGLKNRGYLTRSLEDAPYLDYPDGSSGDYYEVIRRGVVNDIPSLILETAFITSDTDLAILNDSGKINRIGELVADAIAEKYGLRITGNTLKQPVQEAQSGGVSLGSVPKTVRAGEIYTLAASGGSGEGDYEFLVTNPFLGRMEGNKLIVTGSGQMRLTVTRLEGNTTTPRSAGNTTVTAEPITAAVHAEQKIILNPDGTYTARLSVGLDGRSEYVIPRGTVTASVAGIGSASSGFDPDTGACDIDILVQKAGTYDCELSYAPGLYDGYRVSAPVKISLTVGDAQDQTQAPVSTAVPTGVPDPSQTGDGDVHSSDPVNSPSYSASPAADATAGYDPSASGAGTPAGGNGRSQSGASAFGVTELLVVLLVAAVIITAVLVVKLVSQNNRRGRRGGDDQELNASKNSVE